MNNPHHVAIIMDGNGRWAQALGKNRIHGHAEGARTAKNIIEHSAKRGIKNLTLFTFSSENWQRPAAEVTFLMKLLSTQLEKELETLMINNIRFYALGDLGKLPTAVRAVVDRVIAKTAKNTGMVLNFAISYGGRQEITTAVKLLAQQVRAGLVDPDDIDENLVRTNMFQPNLPDPDLVIRTSGEMRISNFMLWQLAYSELYILDKHWPDFNTTDFDHAVDNYSLRERRFGKTKCEEVLSVQLN